MSICLENTTRLNTDSGFGVIVVSISAAIASGSIGVGDSSGVTVTVGVSVIVGVRDMVGVSVIVGVRVIVGEGGNIW